MDFRGVVVLVGLASSCVIANHFHANVDTLQLVQVIFRHGDRAPTTTYPTDPNKNASVWPEGMAQLTSVGKMQQYKLGQYLRRRYDGFLAEKYHAEELYVMSSDMDRTIMSVESNLAGLFPPVHKWHPLIDWQPIPLRTIPWKEDTYLHVNTHCPKYEQLHHDFIQNSEVVRKVNEDNADFVHHLATESGLRANTVKEIISLQDIILTEWIHNLSVPQWAEEALPKLNSLQAEVNTWSTYTEEMKRLRGGPLLDLLIKNMLAKTGALRSAPEEFKRMVAGGEKRKMLMYSAHDSTLARIMNTLGIFHPHNPPYAAALLLELHWDNNNTDHFVKVFYRNETSAAPHELPLPSCPSPCYLADLIRSTEHLIPRDLKEECELGGEIVLRLLKGGTSCVNYAYPDPSLLAAVGVVLFLSSLVMWICLLKFVDSCKGRSSKEERFKLLNRYPHYEYI